MTLVTLFVCRCIDFRQMFCLPVLCDSRFAMCFLLISYSLDLPDRQQPASLYWTCLRCNVDVVVHGTRLAELLQPVCASVGSSRLRMFVASIQAQCANNILHQKGNVMQRCHVIRQGSSETLHLSGVFHRAICQEDTRQSACQKASDTPVDHASRSAERRESCLQTMFHVNFSLRGQALM